MTDSVRLILVLMVIATAIWLIILALASIFIIASEGLVVGVALAATGLYALLMLFLFSGLCVEATVSKWSKPVLSWDPGRPFKKVNESLLWMYRQRRMYQRRRRSQFSLRTLLIFVLVTGAGLGLLGARLVRTWNQDETLQSLQNKFRPEVAYDQERVVGLSFFGANLRDDDLAHLTGLPYLTRLDLSRTQVTDAGLEHLKALSGLQELNLMRTRVTDAGLEHLKGLNKLQVLDLRFTKVAGDGLEHLKGLNELQVLHLRFTKLTDAGLEHLEALTGLQSLDVEWTRVTDAGLEHLKALSGLQELDLMGTRVTDAGLQHLKGMTSLRELDLWATKVTDAGLVHLEGLTNLQRLNLWDTQVTDDGVKQLQQALPNCKIQH